MKFNYDCPEGFKKGYYGGVPIYVKDLGECQDGVIWFGRNWFYDKLLMIVAWIAVNLMGVGGFLIEVETDKNE